MKNASGTIGTLVLLLFAGSVPVAAKAPPGDDLPAAFEECSRFIAAHPGDPQGYRRRGTLNFMLGRVAESVSDFNREVELDPGRDPHHWQRGISYYYLGEFGKGRAQFERHRAVNPHDVENAAWHFFCTARSDGIAAARKAIIPIDVTKDARVPMAAIYRLLAAEGTEEAVLDAANGAPGAQRQALQYAHLYLGLWHEVNGRPERALEHIRRSAEDYSMPHYMGAVARVHLMLRQR